MLSLVMYNGKESLRNFLWQETKLFLLHTTESIETRLWSLCLPVSDYWMVLGRRRGRKFTVQGGTNVPNDYVRT